MTLFRAVVVLPVAGLVVGLVAGCSSPNEAGIVAGDSLFSAAQSRSVLALPPDLLATANDQARDNATAGEAAELVLPAVSGAVIHTEDGRAWLEVDADAEEVWRRLTEFWESEAVELARSDAAAGVMETDWFGRGGGGGLVKSLLARFTALDKFSMRLERDDAATRVFVSHRARHKIEVAPGGREKTADFAWVEREPDAEKVAQLLQAMVLLFGGESI